MEHWQRRDGKLSTGHNAKPFRRLKTRRLKRRTKFTISEAVNKHAVDAAIVGGPIPEFSLADQLRPRAGQHPARSTRISNLETDVVSVQNELTSRLDNSPNVTEKGGAVLGSFDHAWRTEKADPMIG